jgi:hypothetical protein
MKRKDYYNFLPTEIKEKAYANTEEGMLNLEIENVIAAIAGGFSWKETPDFYCKLEQIEKQFA